MNLRFIAAIPAIFLLGSMLQAQSPAPIIVQAVTPQTDSTPKPAPAMVSPSASDQTLKLLQEIKAANAAVLGKQTETLQQLEELEKAAAQIRIFTKRG